MSDKTIPLTAQDEVDLALLGDEKGERRTLLEAWQNVLQDIEQSQAEHISPQVAMKVVASWSQLKFPDVPVYWNLYHENLVKLRTILDEVIERHPDCFKNTEPEGEHSDATGNHAAYLDLLFSWQLEVARWERLWDVTSPDAGASIAAIADASNFYLSQTGLIAHLEQIQFDLTAEEQESMPEKLVARLAEEFGE